MENDKIHEIREKLDSVKIQMHENISMVIENNVTLERIQEQSEDLLQASGVFSKTAKDLRRKMWWKNMKMKLMIGGSISVILLIIILVIVGESGGFNKK